MLPPIVPMLRSWGVETCFAVSANIGTVLDSAISVSVVIGPILTPPPSELIPLRFGIVFRLTIALGAVKYLFLSMSRSAVPPAMTFAFPAFLLSIVVFEFWHES